jgi:hypothetical protein
MFTPYRAPLLVDWARSAARAWNMPVSETILEKPSLAVYALRGGHEREGRFDPLDEQAAGTEQHVHLAGDALL